MDGRIVAESHMQHWKNQEKLENCFPNSRLIQSFLLILIHCRDPQEGVGTKTKRLTSRNRRLQSHGLVLFFTIVIHYSCIINEIFCVLCIARTSLKLMVQVNCIMVSWITNHHWWILGFPSFQIGAFQYRKNQAS